MADHTHGHNPNIQVSNSKLKVDRIYALKTLTLTMTTTPYLTKSGEDGQHQREQEYVRSTKIQENGGHIYSPTQAPLSVTTAPIAATIIMATHVLPINLMWGGEDSGVDQWRARRTGIEEGMGGSGNGESESSTFYEMALRELYQCLF